MAKKMKLMPLFQELKGRAEISDRRPAHTATGIYLMQLRAQNNTTTLPRRRFAISVDPGAAGGLPLPVKINHAGAATTPSAGAGPERHVLPPEPQVHPGSA